MARGWPGFDEAAHPCATRSQPWSPARQASARCKPSYPPPLPWVASKPASWTMKGEVGLDHENLEKLFLEKVKLKIEEWGGGSSVWGESPVCKAWEVFWPNFIFGCLEILSLDDLKFYLWVTWNGLTHAICSEIAGSGEGGGSEKNWNWRLSSYFFSTAKIVGLHFLIISCNNFASRLNMGAHKALV